MIPELSVVLPVRNQAGYIRQVMERYKTAFKNRPWEIILVPNACSDDSPRICRQIAKKNRAIRVVENPAGGWGLSVQTGLKAARGRFLCYANSARTDPALIPALFGLLEKKTQALAKVTRHHRGHLLRGLGSLLYNLECRLLFSLPCGDVNGTPKIFGSRLYHRVKWSEKGDLLDVEFLAQCAKLGVPVLEMPVSGWGRHGGKSSTGFASAARMYGGVLGLWRRLG
jgi:hypothetical protein